MSLTHRQGYNRGILNMNNDLIKMTFGKDCPVFLYDLVGNPQKSTLI